ncbi:MAG: hypothetical protein ACRD96_22620 [Bryobacteraceae bacterium]
MKARSTAGVTLLEVLLAVSLLSLLVAGVVTAMRLGLNAMGQTNNRLMANRRVAGAQRILEQHLRSFMPVTAACSPGPGGPVTVVPFFQGEPDSLRFVSGYSLEEGARGYPRVVELHIIPGEGGRGVRLIVNEHLYSGPLSAGATCLGPAPDPLLGVVRLRFRPIEIGSSSFVLADKLESCRFLYQRPIPGPAQTEWLPLWAHPQWPRAIRVEMTPIEDTPARLRPLSVTASIRVNRAMEIRYGDY